MKINWTKWGTIFTAITLIFTAIMLILVAIQVLPILDIRMPTDFFHDDSYEMYTLTDPLSSDLLPKLHVSPIYYVEVSADVPKTTDYNDEVKFVINTIDKGKNHIIEPKLKAFVVDSVGNIRGIFPDSAQNLSGTNISLNKKITLIFHPPSSDQKIIGIWKLYVYIFDEKVKELASYGVYEFSLTEENQFISNLSLLLIPLIIVEIFLFGVLIYKRTRKYKGSVNQASIISEAVGTDSNSKKYEQYLLQGADLQEQLLELEKQKNKLRADFVAAPSGDMNKEEKTGTQNAK